MQLMVCCEGGGVFCIKALLHANYSVADVDELDISTLVAVDQRAADCLEEAARPFILWSRYRSSRCDVTFYRPLPVFRVVRFWSVHRFIIRITVELFHFIRTAIAR